MTKHENKKHLHKSMKKKEKKEKKKHYSNKQH